MSGAEINRSLAIIVLPLILIFSIAVIIIVLTTVDFSVAFPQFDPLGIASGMSTALPFVGAGIFIGVLIMIYAFMQKRTH